MTTRMTAILLLGALLALAGCGSGKKTAAHATSSAPAAAGEKVALKADPSGALAFIPKQLKAKAGTVSLVMTDPSSSGKAHGIGIQGNGVDKDGPIVQPGSTSQVTARLKPGTYQFYCPIPAHKAAGMTGTLTVS